jgi:PAS domain S-box-containing protein
VTRRLWSSFDESTVLQAVVEGACELTAARYGALALLDHQGAIGVFVTHGLSEEQQRRVGSPPQGLGLLGHVRQLGRPLRLANLADDPHTVGVPHYLPPMTTFLGMPISVEGKNVGSLYLAERLGGGEFTPSDEQILVLFASLAGAAIYNSQLFRREQAARATAEEALSQLRQAELTIDAERQRLEVLVDTSPTGIIVVEGKDTVVLANQEAERITGNVLANAGSLDQFRTTTRLLRADGTESPVEEWPLERALRQSLATSAQEFVFARPDGELVPVIMSARPIHSAQGEVTGAVATVQDVSGLREIERLRNEFLGIVSHELRTPLTAIKGAAATVLGSQLPLDARETRELFQIVDEQADRLRDLVTNLLDMTRIEAGTFSVNAEPTDLLVVIEEAQAAFRRRGDPHDVQVHVPEALPHVQADRRRILQVFANLLSNASRFSPPSTPIIVAVEHDDGSVAVHIRDHGRGMSADWLPHLFEKFSQLHEEDSGLRGTGLGLAICKGIVEAHGGRIRAASGGEDRGTTVTFTLPAVEDVSLPTPAPVQPAQRPVRRGKRNRILVVDDEPQILRYLNRHLDDAGYQVIATTNPAEAIKLIELEDPHLALLDVKLPQINGFELLERIREFSPMPVIFLTASDRTEDVVRGLKLGADGYVVKPFSPEELLARIEAALRRGASAIEERSVFVLGDLKIDFAERLVTVKDAPVSLTATEYKLLYELAIHAGRVLTHDQILQRVWGPDYAGETELVRSHVRYLRRNLGDDAKHPRFILTELQVGYRMPKPDPQ